MSTEATAGNTNVMPCENKGRGPIRVLSHGYWVERVLFSLPLQRTDCSDLNATNHFAVALYQVFMVAMLLGIR